MRELPTPTSTSPFAFDLETKGAAKSTRISGTPAFFRPCPGASHVVPDPFGGLPVPR
jgi:hypothetical protein